MRYFKAAAVMLLLIVLMSACGVKDSARTENTGAEDDQTGENMENTQIAGNGAEQAAGELHMEIDGEAVEVIWEDNEAVDKLKELAGDGVLTVKMSKYGGFEQVGELGATLPGYAVQTTTSAGDIVLYSGDKLVVFYGSNTWSYVRLGKIKGLDGTQLRDMLSGGNVTVELLIK